jgi:hypothetical protein
MALTRKPKIGDIVDYTGIDGKTTRYKVTRWLRDDPGSNIAVIERYPVPAERSDMVIVAFAKGELNDRLTIIKERKS